MGPIAPETRWTITCSRAHERFANSAPTISGVVEKTIARRNPSRCKMRSKRSSKLTPHNSIKASGASAIKIGRMFSITREINGGAARCQLSTMFLDSIDLCAISQVAETFILGYLLFVVGWSTSHRFHLALLVGNGARRDPHLSRFADSLHVPQQNCRSDLLVDL